MEKDQIKILGRVTAVTSSMGANDHYVITTMYQQLLQLNVVYKLCRPPFPLVQLHRLFHIYFHSTSILLFSHCCILVIVQFLKSTRIILAGPLLHYIGCRRYSEGFIEYQTLFLMGRGSEVVALGIEEVCEE